MSKSKWTGAINSDWADATNWSPAGVPGASSNVVIAGGAPVASASIGTVHSITDSSDLRFRSAGTNTVTTFLDNTRHLYVDDAAGAGGTILNVRATLTNTYALDIGNDSLSAPDTVTAAALDNTATGAILLSGSSANQALLDVTGSAGFGTAHVLSGIQQMFGDSAIEFANGQITSLAEGAFLQLQGNDAFLEDSTALGSNSALAGLASIGANANLLLENGASLSTTGTLANNGYLYLEANPGDGGSSLTVGRALTNSGYLAIGNPTLSVSDKVTAAALDNTGKIHLTGSGANQALLDVTGSAGFGTAQALSGDVVLSGDSAIEFKSGEITTLAADAQLHLNGNDAFLEDRTARGSNSALMGLASIGAGAILGLHNQAAVSTTGSLVNDGHVRLDLDRGDGGSSLTVGGTLTNSSTLRVGNATLSASDEMTASSLDNTNTGKIGLTGNGTKSAALKVSGATTNNGSIAITNDTEELAGAVRGAGSINLKSANLRFDSSVSAGQTINETGADALILERAQKFAGTIGGFGTGDTIDAANFLFSGTKFHFAENSAGTGGTLTLHDESRTAHILLTGHYSHSDFTLAPDHGAGTLVKFV